MEKILKLQGRIDTNNISEIEKNIIDEIGDFDGKIIFDAKELEYISSAGLRMILRVKKEHDDTSVINCSTAVYEIFEITGFSQMMDISKAFRSISVEGCEVIGEGFYGKVYRIDPETVVKVYKNVSLDMIKKEIELSKKAFVLGISTAIPYDIVTVGDSYGSVFELLDCKTLDKLINEGASIKDLAKKCVDILKTIHSTKMKDGELPSKKEEIIQRINACEKYLPKDIIEKLIKFIKSIDDTKNMVHGDFHVKNLMKQGDEILLIDLDKISCGNPIFEFGAMYATYCAFSCVNHNNCSEFLGITYEQSKEMWDETFNSYYKDKTDKEKEELLKKLKIISYFQVFYTRVMYHDENNKYEEEEIKYCKDYLVKNLPELV